MVLLTEFEPAAEPRQQHRHIIALVIIQHLVITIAYNPSERLFDHSQIQHLAESVAEYEVLISAYDARTVKALALLIALLLEERFPKANSRGIEKGNAAR